MVFPVRGGVVTTGFWDLRPYSKPRNERTYIHRAWDLAHTGNSTAAIVAPETGEVFYHYQSRVPLTKTAELTWPDGSSYIFSHWYEDTMGGVILLRGDRSGFLYAFGHVDVDVIFHMIENRHITYHWERIAESYNRYINYVITLDRPHIVAEGETIGYIGHSGYSTGYHTHMQIHNNPYDYHSRIDPASLWEHIYINDNGAGPTMGIRDGAHYVPPRDMDLAYLRGN